MIRIDHLTKVYEHDGRSTTVLDDVSLEVAAGEIVAVVGPSGAGKSTLAHCTTLLARPTSGAVVVNGEDLTASSAAELRAARRRIGTIFQSDALFSRRTAAANVALPLGYLGVTAAETRARVRELLDRMGLADKADHYPHQLSGGQRQRVGIARALALRPSVLLSDEATSGLDPASTASILALLRDLRDELGLAVLFITHEMDAVRSVADTVARLESGRIVERGRVVDVLRDPASTLGAGLRPDLRPLPLGDGRVRLDVVYAGPVPGDWLARLAATAREPIELLGASIEQVAGESVGQAALGLAESDAASALRALPDLGLAPRSTGVPSPRRGAPSDAELDGVAA